MAATIFFWSSSFAASTSAGTDVRGSGGHDERLLVALSPRGQPDRVTAGHDERTARLDGRVLAVDGGDHELVSGRPRRRIAQVPDETVMARGRRRRRGRD